MPEVNAAERIAAMYLALGQEAITGVTVQNATAKIPRTIQAAQLPYVVVFPDASQVTRNGDGMLQEVRSYRATLFIEVAVLGSKNQGYDKANPYYEAVRDYFMGRPGLDISSSSDDVFDAEFLGDNGFNLTVYPPVGDEATAFVSITFRHRVTQLLSYQYKD